MMNTSKIQIRENYRLQWEPAQNGFVLLYAEGMVKLNDSAAEILKLCDGQYNVGEITDQLKAKFPNYELDDDVQFFIEEALNHGWITYK